MSIETRKISLSLKFSIVLTLCFYLFISSPALISNRKMAGKVEDIEKRIEVLNSLVAGSVLTDDIITSLTTRDGLLDALLVLYEECSHDYLVTKNKHVAAFVRKCKNEVLSFVILFHIYHLNSYIFCFTE